jgi:hypothetical protein
VDDGERTTGGLSMRVTRHYAQEGTFGGRTREVDVWAGLDVGKNEHFAESVFWARRRARMAAAGRRPGTGR